MLRTLRLSQLLVAAFPVTLVIVLLVGTAAGLRAQQEGQETRAQGDEEDGELSGVDAATSGLELRSGLLDLWIDRNRGKVFVEVPPPQEGSDEVGRYLYVEGLVTGLGSNPVGLDRGQIGDTRVVALRRIGNRLLVEAENLAFRALSEDPSEVRAVDESFADTVLWAGPVTALDPDGRALVDFTSFVVRDAHRVVATLRRTGQGAYSLDPERSVVEPEASLAFPENLELEAVLTYQASEEPGELAARTAAAPDAFTLVQHHSLIQLPDEGYEPRLFHPGSGSFAISFADYAAPLDAPLRRQWVVRHRLEPVDARGDGSPAVEPIVYYVDRGAPEPVRGALIEGASWWNEAFAAAGFEDAFRVEVLPEGAHPLDVRYNVIQWVHRATRGWSYGGGVVDPRTGEMIKGHVSLGSLRVRQDRRIFEGLAGVEETGSGAPDDPVELALARIRQLAAHEVGHTLGLAHNFAASTYGRASVMDYPAPLVEVGPDGQLDFSRVYDTGVGEFDLQSVRYAYTAFPPGVDEEQGLQEILRENRERGLLFLTDADARPAGAAAPLANLWDNHGDPVTGLEQVLAVRRKALTAFGEDNVAPGRPLALLQEVLAPVYFYHRYQLTAATKVVGGLEYRYALRGDPAPQARPVPAELQRRGLRVVLSTLEPEALDLPEEVLRLLLPRPHGTPRNRELFGTATGPVFDALGAAATASEMAVAGLLHPERAARLVDFTRRDPALPSLEEVLDAVVEKAFGGGGAADPRHAEIRRSTQAVVVDGLIDLASDPAATPAVRARTEAALATLADRLRDGGAAEGESRTRRAHRSYLAAEIGRYLERVRRETSPLPEPAEPPPGSPIGTDRGADWIGRGCAMDGMH